VRYAGQNKLISATKPAKLAGIANKTGKQSVKGYHHQSKAAKATRLVR
jgi:hypothetical protein